MKFLVETYEDDLKYMKTLFPNMAKQIDKELRDIGDGKLNKPNTILYHKSNNLFDKFDRKYIRSNQGGGRNISGFWFFNHNKGPDYLGKYTYRAIVDTSHFYVAGSSNKILNKNNIKHFIKKYFPNWLTDEGNIQEIHQGYVEEKLSNDEKILALIKYAAIENGIDETTIIKDLGYNGYIFPPDEYVVFDENDIKILNEEEVVEQYAEYQMDENYFSELLDVFEQYEREN